MIHSSRKFTQPGTWLDVTVIALVWLIASWPWICGWSYIPYDSIDLFFPHSYFVVSSLLRGEAPWWNPYTFGGTPFLGDAQNMIFTPHTLVGLLTGSDYNFYWFNLTSLACLLVGGIAFYIYGRMLTANRLLIILGAILFMMGGATASRLQHTVQIVSYAYLPIQLILIRLICIKPTVARTALLFTALFITLLNPNHVVFLSAFMLIPLGLLHWQASAFKIRALIALVFAATLALLCAFPLFQTIAETLRFSNRADLGLIASSGFSYRGFHPLSLFLPGLFGLQSPTESFWAWTDITQDYLYIGTLPFLLLAYACVRIHELPRYTLVCLGLLVVFFMYGMGGNAPLFPWLFDHAPGFSFFRRPTDGAFMVNVLIALLIATLPPTEKPLRWKYSYILTAGLLAALIAYGFFLLAAYATQKGQTANFHEALNAFGLRMVVATLLISCALWLSKKNILYFPALLLIIATAADLSSAGRIGVLFAAPYAPRELAQIYKSPNHLDEIQNPLAETMRFLKNSDAAGDIPQYRMEALGGALGANLSIPFRIAFTQGYNPINIKRYGDIFEANNKEGYSKLFTPSAPAYTSEYYRQLGLRYVLFNRSMLAHQSGPAVLIPAMERIRHVFEGCGEAHLLPVPGAYEVWELPNPVAKATLRYDDNPDKPVQTCDIVSYRNTSATYRCRADSPATLVVNDAFFPGWHACVNGKSTEIKPYKEVFRAIPLEAGDNTISFHYQPVPLFRNKSCSL